MKRPERCLAATFAENSRNSAVGSLRSGMTLIEIILALGLSMLVFAAITTGIYVYMFTLTRQQVELEQQQVVRSVAQMIANDLRGALQYKPADVSGLANLSLTEALMGGLGGSLGGASQSPGGESEGGGEAQEGQGQQGPGQASGNPSETGAQEPTSEEDTATYRPILIGNNAALSIDISRLPRIDQYHTLMMGSDLGNQTPSDLKSVVYMLGAGNPSAVSQEFDPEIAALGGLYRRQIDRAIAAYRGEYGPPGGLDEYCQLIAPEIVQIEFRYFNGSDWFSEWDSETEGGFPTAIEVTLGFDTRPLEDRQLPNANGPGVASAAFETVRLYRQVVHLPISEAAQ